MRPAELDRAAADFRQSLDAMNDATIRAIRVARQILEPFRCTPGPEGAGPAPRVTLSSRAGETAMQFTSALPGRTDPAAEKAAGSPLLEGAGDYSQDQIDDSMIDDDEDDGFDGDECGRWDNGKLSGSCDLAGTEYCDWECPFRGRSATEIDNG